jgi:hypothetical protein
MAGAALHLRVRALQRVPGASVVESLGRALLEGHHLELAPAVIGMAFGTRPILDPGVEAAPGRAQCGNLSVTREAAVFHAIAGAGRRMALEAGAVGIEIAVRGGPRSG